MELEYEATQYGEDVTLIYHYLQADSDTSQITYLDDFCRNVLITDGKIVT